MRGLGIIGYDANCVAELKLIMGDQFAWRKDLKDLIIVPEEKFEV